jgi:hypothetical protein
MKLEKQKKADVFIGSITDREAKEMKDKIKRFRTLFDRDIKRRQSKLEKTKVN